MPTNQDEIDSAWRLYSSKYDGAEESKTNKDLTALIFVPTWWRYSEIKSKPMVIISSEDKAV